MDRLGLAFAVFPTNRLGRASRISGSTKNAAHGSGRGADGTSDNGSNRAGCISAFPRSALRARDGALGVSMRWRDDRNAEQED
jgi:hypothetical protein